MTTTRPVFRHPWIKKVSPHWPAAVFLALILILNAWVLSRLAFLDFSDTDWGGFLDASWRVFRGQKVYHDFYFHSGPMHLYMNAFFFKLFGFGKSAILMHLIFINSLMVLATFFATYKRIPLFFTLLTSVHTLTAYYWIYPHPYYDYSAHFWGLLGMLALARFQAGKGWRYGFAAGFFCGAMAVFATMTKINIGAVYGLVFLSVILTLWKQRGILTGYAAGVAAALAGMLATVHSVPEMITSISEFNSTVSDRLIRFLFVPVYVKNFFWLPLLLVYLLTRGRKRTRLPLYTLFVGGYGIAVFSINTGSFRGWDYLPMMGMYLGLGYLILFDLLKEPLPPWRRRLTLAAVVLMSLAAGYQIYRTASVSAAGVSGQMGRDRYRLQTPVFEGWQFSDPHGRDLDAMVRYIREVVPQEETFLILSNLQIVYALAERDSFRGITFHWYPGSVPAPGPQWEKVRDAILDHPPDWILTYRDGPQENPLNEIIRYLQIPMDFLSAHYEVVQSWHEHALLRRR